MLAKVKDVIRKIEPDAFYTLDETTELMWYKSKNSIQYLIKQGYLEAKVYGGTHNYRLRKVQGSEIIRYLDMREI